MDKPPKTLLGYWFYSFKEFVDRCPKCKGWTHTYYWQCEHCNYFIDSFRKYSPTKSEQQGREICSYCGWYKEPAFLGLARDCKNIDCPSPRLTRAQMEEQVNVINTATLELIIKEVLQEQKTGQVSPPPEPPLPPSVDPPIPPPPDTSSSELNRLAQSYSELFSAFPLKHIPPVFIHPDEHFKLTKRNTRALAHYEYGYNSSSDCICFRQSYLAHAPSQDIIATMQHELIHAWLDQHSFKQQTPHDTHFEIVAKLLKIKWIDFYRRCDEEDENA